jgi:predicted HTH domain antitoxin
MVATRSTPDRKIKVSLSLDPALVQFLDAYVSAHPLLNRSRVIELAVREFRQRQIELELEAQYAAPEPEDVQRELADWRQIRRAAAQRALGSK